MDESIHELGALIATFVGADFKYVKSKLALVKTLSDGTQAITLDLLPASEQGKAKLAMNAQIRLNILEDQYGPLHPFLNAKERKTHPTLAVNCDSLFSDKALTQSISIKGSNLEQVASKYSQAIKTDVIPFFEKYYSVENLVASFEQPEPSAWVTSDRNTRYLVLLSAYSIESKWEDFERVASQYLAYCEKPFAQAYYPLAKSVIEGLRN